MKSILRRTGFVASVSVFKNVLVYLRMAARKQEEYAEAYHAEFTLWDAANRHLHANLPEDANRCP